MFVIYAEICLDVKCVQVRGSADHFFNKLYLNQVSNVASVACDWLTRLFAVLDVFQSYNCTDSYNILHLKWQENSCKTILEANFRIISD